MNLPRWYATALYFHPHPTDRYLALETDVDCHLYLWWGTKPLTVRQRTQLRRGRAIERHPMYYPDPSDFIDENLPGDHRLHFWNVPADWEGQRITFFFSQDPTNYRAGPSSIVYQLFVPVGSAADSDLWPPALGGGGGFPALTPTTWVAQPFVHSGIFEQITAVNFSLQTTNQRVVMDCILTTSTPDLKPSLPLARAVGDILAINSRQVMLFFDQAVELAFGTTYNLVFRKWDTLQATIRMRQTLPSVPTPKLPWWTQDQGATWAVAPGYTKALAVQTFWTAGTIPPWWGT